MKNYLLLILASVILLSCERSNFTLSGTIEQGVECGDSVHLQYIENGRPYKVAGDAVKNGTFTINGYIDRGRLCYLTTIVNNKIKSKAELYVEPGDIELNINALRSVVSGTFLNTRLQEYRDSIDILDSMFKRYYSRNIDETLSQKAIEEAEKAMKVLSVAREEYITRFLEKNIDNPVSNYILSKNYDLIDPEKGARFIARMPLENKSDTLVRHIERTFHNKVATSEGKRFTDFGALSTDKRAVRLSHYVGKGKIAVLNIWSTQSRNLARDISTIKSAYEAYGDKVQFVGFAIENNPEALKTAVKRNNMQWEQMSDFMGWGSKAIFSYGINSYPYIIVFDADGFILRRNIKPSELNGYLNSIVK